METAVVHDLSLEYPEWVWSKGSMVSIGLKVARVSRCPCRSPLHYVVSLSAIDLGNYDDFVSLRTTLLGKDSHTSTTAELKSGHGLT